MLAHIVRRLEPDFANADGCCMNPNVGACWRDESNVGVVMRVVKSVASKQVGVRAIEYMSAGLNLRIARRQRALANQ